MEARNWSQRDLAKKAKISQGAISHVINGARQPGADFCLAIADAFGLPPAEVFQRKLVLWFGYLLLVMWVTPGNLLLWSLVYVLSLVYAVMLAVLLRR